MSVMKIAPIAVFGLLALAGNVAQAAPTSLLEVKIELRVLDFISNPVERSQVAVIYDRGDRSSADAAGAILQDLQQSQNLVRNKISARLVERHALAPLKDLKAVILPAGLEDEAILRYGIANQTLVLSSGTGCVRDHRCMVGVTTQPEIEIGVDRPALDAGGIKFADGFELMVKEY